jgi:hypothetical protein
VVGQKSAKRMSRNLRVMLAGHPHLFAPPELELLSFNTLRERAEAFAGRNSVWLEGTVRALMEIHGWDAQRAKDFLNRCEQQDLTTQQLYAIMQKQLGQRVLVEKTPAYALDLAILQRAEETFEQAHYIHLIRHPSAMLHSFEEASLDQVFFRYAHPFETRELAELIWLLSHQNIRAFFQAIPADRRIQVHFEELVQNPEGVMRAIAAFLHLEFHSDMLQPYVSQRMTDGISASSKMLGDIKFHQPQTIDAGVIDRWQKAPREPVLGEMTRRMAEVLGYHRWKAVPTSQTETSGQSSPENKFLTIEPVPRQGEQAFPLSFAQQRLWFLDQFEPGSSMYLVPNALRIGGKVDVSTLQRSLQELVRRHESLRTTFEERDGQPMQVIHPAGPYTLPVIDLQRLAKEQQEQVVRRLASQERQHPCDLTTGPLLRTALLRLEQQGHVLLLTLHHIVTDGWSNGVLMRELTLLYQAKLRGQPSPLAPLPVQYADYALWQREWLQGEVLNALLTYWTKQLRGAVPLEMPTDRPRAMGMSHRGASHPFALSSHLWRKLVTLSRQEGVTLFMTLLTAFQILLYRSTGQQDIVVGIDSANRTVTETEQMIGFFVNLLVLRARISPQATFRKTVRRVCTTVLDAYTHQELPFEKPVDALQLERNPHQTPLVNVLFVSQNMPQKLPEVPGWTVSPIGVETHTAKFDLALFLTEGVQEIRGFVNYRADLFEPEKIARLYRHFETLLESIVISPDIPLERLEMFTEEEKEQKFRDETVQQEMLRRELKVTKRQITTWPHDVF